MKIAIASDGNFINEHLGQCKSYRIFTVTKQGHLADEEIFLCEEGCACKSGTAINLADKGVNVLIAGNMGAGAYAKLTNEGIRVYRGCSGDIKAMAESYIQGELKDSGSTGDSPADGHHHCHHAK